MEKQFIYNVGQKVLCPIVSGDFYNGQQKVFTVIRQLPLAVQDYEIEAEDKTTYPVFESELEEYVSDDEIKLREMFDDKHSVKPLTPRQQWFRRLLDDMFDRDDEQSLSQQQVYDAYLCDLIKPDGVVYPEYDGDKANEHNSAALREIRKDFKAIKTSGNTQGIYISSVRGYKRANQSEVYDYLKTKLIHLSRYFKEYWEEVDRNDKNGQMRIKLTEKQSEVYDPYKIYR